MVSLETAQATTNSAEPISSPRKNFISISPNSQAEKQHEKTRNKEFEFLSSNSQTMLSADELFFEGKLLPFWQMQQSEKLNKMSLKTEHTEEGAKVEDVNKEDNRLSWFLDDDPSPRPPKCTVLWKELLRLKKQRGATLLSPSSSSSSSLSSLVDLPSIEEGNEGSGKGEKHVKRIKKTLERTRSASIRLRRVINVPISTQGKNSGLPPLFSFRKGKLER